MELTVVFEDDMALIASYGISLVVPVVLKKIVEFVDVWYSDRQFSEPVTSLKVPSTVIDRNGL